MAQIPPYYFESQNQLTTRASLFTEFERHVKNNVKHNQLNIKVPETIRIATFNVHYWTDLHERSSFDNLLEDIKNLNADVICLQEVSFGCTKFHQLSYDKLMQIFASIGYQYHSKILTQPYLGADFGNAIFSKLPITNQQSGLLTKGSSRVRRGYCCVHIPLLEIDICCVHLDVFDETGETRRLQLRELIDKLSHIKSDNLIICGDFNATRAADYSQVQLEDMIKRDTDRNVKTDLQTLEIIDKIDYHSCFDHINQISPNCTVWSCRATDYIFVSKKFNYKIERCGVYFTINSDHLPIYMDINQKQNA